MKMKHNAPCYGLTHGLSMSLTTLSPSRVSTDKGYDSSDSHEVEQLHWFGVTDPDPLCSWCWQRSSCPREFAFRPRDHEILYGIIPISSIVGQQLFRQARSWIEATQSYEKNQLGLSQFFLNSLRLTWIVCLLADTVALPSD
jgi:hypothetical protein